MAATVTTSLISAGTTVVVVEPSFARTVGQYPKEAPSNGSFLYCTKRGF